MNSAIIKGMGWVFQSSLGSPGNVTHTGQEIELPKLSGKSVLGAPYKPFGRMDNFSRLGFSAIAFAMAHAGIEPDPYKSGLTNAAPLKPDTGNSKKDIGIIASSKTGCLETDFLYQATLSRKQGVLPSPAIFAYTLPSCFIGEASIYYGLTGESFMVEESENTGLTALSMAMDILACQKVSAMVCGVCNSDIPSMDNGCRPGSLFLVLEKNHGQESTENCGNGQVHTIEQSSGKDPGHHADDPSGTRIIRQADSPSGPLFYHGKNQITSLTQLAQDYIDPSTP